MRTDDIDKPKVDSILQLAPPPKALPQSILELCRKANRSISKGKLREYFLLALKDDPTTTLKSIFYIRDIQYGRGEKLIFLSAFSQDWEDKENKRIQILNSKIFWELVSYYGTWKTVLDLGLPLVEQYLINNKNQVKEEVKPNLKLKPKLKPKPKLEFKPDGFLSVLKETLNRDLNRSDSISLLAKWLPSESKALARAYPLSFNLLIETLADNNKILYRKSLSQLRSKLDIVEQKMCSNNWDKIDPDKVPYKARRKYRKAFKRHKGISKRFTSWERQKAEENKLKVRKKKKIRLTTDILSLKSAVEHNPRYYKVEELAKILSSK